MSYTFSGTADVTLATPTQSFSVGATANPYVWVAISVLVASGTPTVTVGGVSLNLDSSDSIENWIFSGQLTGGLSGSQNVTVTATGSSGSGTNLGFSVWYDSTDTISLGNTGTTGSGGANNFTLGVTSGQFMFALGVTTQTSPSFSGSSPVPTANHTISSGGESVISADWVIASTTTATVATSPSGGFFGAAAAYNNSPGPPPVSYITIGIGGSEW